MPLQKRLAHRDCNAWTPCRSDDMKIDSQRGVHLPLQCNLSLSSSGWQNNMSLLNRSTPVGYRNAMTCSNGP
jgi:hypothetical protein